MQRGSIAAERECCCALRVHVCCCAAERVATRFVTARRAPPRLCMHTQVEHAQSDEKRRWKCSEEQRSPSAVGQGCSLRRCGFLMRTRRNTQGDKQTRRAEDATHDEPVQPSPPSEATQLSAGPEEGKIERGEVPAANAPAGNAEVRVRIIGFSQASKTVAVTPGQTPTARGGRDAVPGPAAQAVPGGPASAGRSAVRVPTTAASPRGSTTSATRPSLADAIDLLQLHCHAARGFPCVGRLKHGEAVTKA